MVRINNTSNVQVEVMRPNLLITALETVRYNQYRQQSELRLFELGKSYLYLENDYQEIDHLALTISGWHQESWLELPFPPQNEYFVLKTMVENILFMFGIREWNQEIIEGGSWSNALRYLKNDLSLVTFGEVSQAICKEMDVRGKVFFADFQWSNLLVHQKVDDVQINEPSRFPVVKRDLALVVNRETSFISVKSVIEDSLGNLVRAIKLFDVYRNEEVLGQGKKSYAVSILLSDSTKTFSDKEVDLMMGNLVKLLENEVGARLR
jgi:phenylalanyl-tRNA synthetase beta chain